MEDGKNNLDKQSLKLMDFFTKDWKIFIDTCSLLSPGIDKFWVNIIPFLRKNSNKIFMPIKVIEELQKFERDINDIARAKKAHIALKNIKMLLDCNEEFIDIRKGENNNFADNVFLTVFTQHRIKNKLLLITQDKKLSRDILNLNESKSVKGKEVRTMKINKYGFFSNVEDKSTSYTPDSEKFRLCTTVNTTQDRILPVTYLPDEGDTVYTRNGSVQLKKKLAAGGAGIIYETDGLFIAKIYKKDKNTQRRKNKIELMLSKKIECEGICYPVEALYNQNREFIGYLMPCAKGKEIQKSIFIKALFKKTFPDWKKRDTVELCITILKKIKYLHDRNIILGDINPMNILVVSPKEVYFVDVDSYQIEDFPCPVGMTNFTAPEIQGKHFPDFLRTMGNENFAVATLLFMIMLPGKPPYSQQGGGDPAANIIGMNFSYPFGDNSNKKTPEGPWRYIWSHLTYAIKEAFYQTFRKNEKHSAENTRLDVDKWLHLFNQYLYLLDSGRFAKQDEMSVELFPTRHKKSSKIEYSRCIKCGKEFPSSKLENHICHDCLNKGEVYTCKKCGKELIYTNYEKYVKKSPKHELCKDCYEYMRQPYRYVKCVDCGKTFEITNGEHLFYKKKGFDLPKRCKDCRKNSSSSTSGYRYNSTSDTSQAEDSFLKKLFGGWF